jgi:hypothetical protein
VRLTRKSRGLTVPSKVPHGSKRTQRLQRETSTNHPAAAWTPQQICGAFPDHTAPAYQLRDRYTTGTELCHPD